MNSEQLTRLGARLFGGRVADADVAIRAIADRIPQCAGLCATLSKFGGAIVFDNGAKFMTDEPSPLNDEHGYQSLEILFGPGDGKYSIEHQTARYAGEVPAAMVPIGEAPGGNLVCVDQDGAVYLWNHQSARDENLCRVAGNLDECLNRLEPDDSELGDTSGIQDSESYLDF